MRRSPRRGFYELVLLSSVRRRPFRCQSCGNRFYAFKLNGDGSRLREQEVAGASEATLPILVYGYATDEKPFQENTNARLTTMHSAEFTLTTKVGIGEKLVLLDPASDEDQQRCEVECVTEQPDGNNIVTVRFRHSVWDFWSATKFSNGEHQH